MYKGVMGSPWGSLNGIGGEGKGRKAKDFTIAQICPSLTVLPIEPYTLNLQGSYIPYRSDMGD